MADGDGQFGFLGHKVGPLPVWMWGLIIVGAYYWYENYGPGATSSTTATTTVDESANMPSQPQYGASQYSSNAEWEGAALNYLVGESIPPDQASSALYNYLHSKALTTQEQHDVNLAIEGIGPPPNIPAPAQVSTPTPNSSGTNPGGPNKGKGKAHHPAPKPRKPAPKRPHAKAPARKAPVRAHPGPVHKISPSPAARRRTTRKPARRNTGG